jgi:hypothetical protein
VPEYRVIEQAAPGINVFRLTLDGASLATFSSRDAALNTARLLARDSHARGESVLVSLRLRGGGVQVVDSLLARPDAESERRYG